MAKVTPSEPVALETVLICLNFISEAPMKMTNVASTQIGMNEIKLPSNSELRRISPPATKLATLVLAPDWTFSVDLVREPEAGIPAKNAQPKFPKPMDIVSWFVLILEPALAAKDLPIDNPSRRQSRETAKAEEKITSQ